MLAACSPAPNAMASSASMWRSVSRPPSAADTAAMTPGTRVPPPMSSTASSSSTGTPVSSRRALSGAPARSSSGAASSSNFSLVTVDLKSTSSVSPSTLMGASLFAERISLVLRTSFLSFATDLGAPRTSTPCLSLTSPMKCSTSTASKSAPPRAASHLRPFTSNCPTDFFLPASLAWYELNSRSAAVVDPLPMSYSTTRCVVLEKSLSMPHCRPAAACSETSARTLRPATAAASSSAWRSGWPKKAGTVTTASRTWAPASASAIFCAYCSVMATTSSEVYVAPSATTAVPPRPPGAGRRSYGR
mmetsp:Transcript_2205/g.7720  ORF Transcript_2205/g.7720 Transcript_2205/m.7720 type:complete len:304 (+) Transcript_2205:1736-2647(+)